MTAARLDMVTEILTVAVVAAKYFQNHHERALCLLIRLGYLRPLIGSRFNRYLHRLRDWLYGIVMLIGEVFVREKVSSSTVCHCTVCKRARARRCQKVRGKAFCGYCAAKREKFFGWRLHLVCTTGRYSGEFRPAPGGPPGLDPDP